MHAARLATCRFTIGAVEFSVSSYCLVLACTDTYAGERPSQFSPPFSPFELVHCCIGRYLCIAQVRSPSQEGGGSRAKTRTPVCYIVPSLVSGSLCTQLCSTQAGVPGRRLVRLIRSSGSPLGTWMGPWLLPGSSSALGMHAHTPSFQCNNVFVPCVLTLPSHHSFPKLHKRSFW